MKETNSRRQMERFLLFVLFAVLILWSIPYTTKGIDVRDTASYLTKYRYIFNQDIQVNELYYFLGEVAGGILYALAPIRKVLILNLTSSLLYVLTAVILYNYLKKWMPRAAALASVLVGTFYGIPWVRTLNWNAWTSLLLALGLVLLLRGLEKDREKLLGISGFVLGINTYFRMPNALFLALILVIFWKYILELRNPREAIRRCLPFFLGACAAAVTGLLLALVILGPAKVFHDLSVLLSIGAGANEGNTHSVTTGIYLFLLGMRDGLLAWLRYMVPAALLYAAAWGILKLRPVRRLLDGSAQNTRAAAKDGQSLEETDSNPVEGRIYAILCGTGAILMGIAGALGDVLTAHELTAAGAIFAGTYGTLYYGLRKRDLPYSCLCAAVVIIMGFLTIGTDTGVNYYRVFLGLPIAFLMSLCVRLGEDAGKGRPLAVGLGCFLAACILGFTGGAGLRYALTHVYHDAPNRELTETISHPLYEGVYTSKERAQSLERLMKELAPYEDEKLLQIGCFNIGCVLTDMEPFYDSSWPDLEYLPMEEFEGQLEEAVREGELPVLLLGTAEESGINWSPAKYQMIQKLGESSLYRTLCVDELYTIYVPANG